MGCRMTALPVLAIDLGGTKILAALVDQGHVLTRTEVATDRGAGPSEWIAAMVAMTAPWQGRYDRAGITVTGLVHDRHWSALNPGTLNIPDRFPLGAAAEAALGVAVTLCNDAQAAAWGEYVHGAGAGQDMVFLTVSTGIGGGVVAGGRLLTGRSGMAASFGQLLPLPDGDPAARFEDACSGKWIEKTTGMEAREAFRAAAITTTAAQAIATSATRVGRLCQNLQLIFDPALIVIGGGVGLAPTYLDRVRQTLAHLPDHYRPTLTGAALGRDAGAVGIAALTTSRN